MNSLFLQDSNNWQSPIFFPFLLPCLVIPADLIIYRGT